MGVSIKNEAVEAAIRELAEATGASVTEAVGEAVREALVRRRRYTEAEIRARRARIDKIVEEVRNLPVYDERPIDELLQDEDGLPR